jgi:DNA end-binding protein Ku
MVRSIWKGHLRFSLIAIAVKLYAATEAAEEIKFNELHRGECLGRVGRESKCKKCAQVVTPDAVIKGYQFETDRYVTVEKSDLDAIKLETDKIIDIIGFVAPTEIPSTYYDEPCYLGADGATAERPYVLLREVMEQTGKVGLGKVTMRGREEFVTIQPHGRGLTVQKLRYPRELRDIAALPGIPDGITLDANELALATRLLEQMETTFEAVDTTDRYHEKLKAMLADKQNGTATAVSTEAATTAPTVSILAALEASLKAVKPTKKAASLKLVGKGKQKKRLPKAA